MAKQENDGTKTDKIREEWLTLPLLSFVYHLSTKEKGL